LEINSLLKDKSEIINEAGAAAYIELTDESERNHSKEDIVLQIKPIEE
jgi:hypothetical protein